MMKQFACILFIVVILSGCARQDLAEGGLESLATWSNLGGNVDSFNSERIYSLAFNAAGDPIVATTASRLFPFSGQNIWQVRVKQWEDQQWTDLGGVLNVRTSRNAQGPSLAVDKLGRPLVTWSEDTPRSLGEGSNIYVKRWDGEAWVSLGEALDVISGGASYPSLAVDSQNRPVVAWREFGPGDFNNGNLYVKRWENDLAWAQLGDALDIDLGGDVFQNSIAVDPSDRVVVAWTENDNIYVKRWNGSRWLSLGGPLDINLTDRAFYPSLALSSTGQPYVAWDALRFDAFFNATRHVYVKRWDRNGTWTQLGGAVSAGVRGQLPTLAISGTNTPMVAWASWGSSAPNNIYVRRWNGVDRWVNVGGQPVVVEGSNQNLGISPAGVPFLAYDYFGEPTDPSDNSAYVKRYE
jgi:hypothetical protein